MVMLTVKLYRQDGDISHEYTDAEYAQHEKDALEEQERQTEIDKNVANTQRLVESANAKLAAVGLTADEIEALRTV